jgi:thioredoxin 1
MQTPAIESAAHTYDGRLRFALVDYDQSPALVARYVIQGLPTILVLRDGDEVERRVGLMGRGSLVDVLKKHVVSAGR